jgi:hypothetical protein
MGLHGLEQGYLYFPEVLLNGTIHSAREIKSIYIIRMLLLTQAMPCHNSAMTWRNLLSDTEDDQNMSLVIKL